MKFSKLWGVLLGGLPILYLLVVLPMVYAQEITRMGPPGGSMKSVAWINGQALLAGSFHGKVYFSPNKGNSWQEITIPLLTEEMVVEEISVHQPSQQVYMGIRDLTGGMLLRISIIDLYSAPGNWEKIGPSVAVRALAIRQSSPAAIYIGTDERMFYSLDDGASWIISLNPFPDPQIESLALSPDDNVIYAGSWQRCYKTANNGKKWDRIHAGMAPDSDVFTLMFDASGRLWAGTCGYAYMSSNHGQSWVKQKTGLLGKRVHRLVLDENNEVLAGTDHGLYRWDNSGKSWKVLIKDTGIQDIAPGSGVIVCATEGEGMLRLDMTSGAIEHINRGVFASSPKKILMMDSGDIWTGILYQDAGGGVWRYHDANWEQMDLPLVDTTIRDMAVLPGSLAIAAGDGVYRWLAPYTNMPVEKFWNGRSVKCLLYHPGDTMLMAGTFQGVLTLNLVSGKTDEVMALQDANVNCFGPYLKNSPEILVGCQQGLLGYSLKSKSLRTILPDIQINRIVWSSAASRLFIAASDGMYFSADNGQTFTKMHGILPNVSCLDITENQDASFALFADEFVYYLPDKETSWRRMIRVPKLSWSLFSPPQSRKVYIGTNGLGILIIKY